MKLEKLVIKIEKGKQVGFSHFIEMAGRRYWESAGIQKWQGKYKVYVGRIEEDKMAAEEFEKDIIKEFQNLSEGLEYIRANSSICIEQLGACKGQKIFNPSFDPYEV